MITLKVHTADPPYRKAVLLAEELVLDAEACDVALRYWFGPSVNAPTRKVIVAALAALDEDHPRMTIVAVGLNIQLELTAR